MLAASTIAIEMIEEVANVGAPSIELKRVARREDGRRSTS